ncbi:hypothetical protein LEP1GSC196_3402 [Leptospira meyeri serovar Semaranga str. Veldrot Semarang 173]|nr:hypothetical protein LEP1GSC196_3402 [Leptospira meyeri serovar Semaranga str. Veldrot Semarang 173]
MNDVLTLDSMESRKRLNKKPVKQCIMESYCYLMALYDRLETGDLFGGLVELTPEQMKSSFGVDIGNGNVESSGTELADLDKDTNETDSMNQTSNDTESTGTNAVSTDEENDSSDDPLDDDILPSGNPF